MYLLACETNVTNITNFNGYFICYLCETWNWLKGKHGVSLVINEYRRKEMQGSVSVLQSPSSKQFES